MVKTSSLLILAKIFNDDYFKIRIFKLSDFDQGIIKHAIQTKYEFLVCLKKVIQKNGKKVQFLCIQDYVMQKKKTKFCKQKFFLENVSLSTKFGLRVKKSFGAISILIKIDYAASEKSNFRIHYQLIMITFKIDFFPETPMRELLRILFRAINA